MDHGFDLLDEGEGGGDGAAELLFFLGAVDLDKDLDGVVAFESDLLEFLGEAEGIDGMDEASELDDLSGLVSLEVTDHVPADGGGLAARGALPGEGLVDDGGSLDELLDAVLAEVSMAEGDEFADLVGVGVLGDGDEVDGLGRSSGASRGVGEARADGGVAFLEGGGERVQTTSLRGLAYRTPVEATTRREEQVMGEGTVRAGDRIEDFVLQDQDRKEWRLSEAVKRGDVVLCFFPFAFTGVCGTEMACITRELASWTERGAEVVGISCDSWFALKAWAASEGFRHRLLSDQHRKVSASLGLSWTEMNTTKRATVVVGKDAGGAARVKWMETREPKDAMKWEDVIAQVS